MPFGDCLACQDQGIVVVASVLGDCKNHRNEKFQQNSKQVSNWRKPCVRDVVMPLPGPLMLHLEMSKHGMGVGEGGKGGTWKGSSRQ